jgi:hypothetical protein
MENEELEEDLLGDIIGTDEDENELPVQKEVQDNQQSEEEDSEESNESEYYEAFDIVKSFGVEDGMVQYGEDKVHISELDFYEQMDIIGQLREKELERLSNIPEFDETEQQVLQEAISNGMNLVEYINAVREQDRLQLEKEFETILMQDRLERELPNIKDLSDDEVMLYHLKQTLDEASDEELATALEERKNLSTYSKEVSKLRTQLAERQEYFKEEQVKLKEQENQQFIQEHFNNSVAALNKLDSIAGFELNVEQKQAILKGIAETDSEYETFMTKNVMTNPELQAKAFWFLTHEQELSKYIQDLEEKLVKIEKDAYNRGKNDTIKGKYPSSPPVKSNNTVNINNNKSSNILDELY